MRSNLCAVDVFEAGVTHSVVRLVHAARRVTVCCLVPYMFVQVVISGGFYCAAVVDEELLMRGIMCMSVCCVFFGGAGCCEQLKLNTLTRLRPSQKINVQPPGVIHQQARSVPSRAQHTRYSAPPMSPACLQKLKCWPLVDSTSSAHYQ